MNDLKNFNTPNLIDKIYDEENVNKNKTKKNNSQKRRINLSVNFYPKVKIINVECFKDYNKIIK
jgi:hypothetical protein